jgi:UDP-N-acetylglucosamine acyltransferase
VISGKVSVGPDCRLIGNVYLKGPLTLGKANVIYPFSCIGFAPQDRKFDGDSDGAGTVVGDDNIFREGVTIHRATGEVPTTVGHRNYFMGNSHAAHDAIVGNDCYFTNGSLLAGHVVIGDRVILGGNAGVAQRVRIGRMSMIAGAEGVTLDVPPFCMCHHTRQVSGLNLIGLRRAGYREHIEPLKEAFDILYRQGHTRPRAVEFIRQQLPADPLVQEFAEFVASSVRGITDYGVYKD